VDLDHETARVPSPRETRDPVSGPREPCVAILLSTFNGERYLKEQLHSYTTQTHGNWQLYWRDDGSTDASEVLMSAFAKGQRNGRCVHLTEDGQLRTTGSFFALLRMALPEGASCFAFSDQDDVWLPDKLAHAVSALGQVAPGRPAIYFCARTLVDSTLQPIGSIPPLSRPPGFPAALTQNVIPGCCMILNRAAAELIDSAKVPDSTWHDWWCYILVSAADGIVIAGDAPDILYRQHPGNLVGEPRGFWRRAARAIRRGRVPFMTVFWRHIAALRTRPELLPEETRALVTIIDRARREGMVARLKALRIPGFVRQTWSETLLFRVWCHEMTRTHFGMIAVFASPPVGGAPRRSKPSWLSEPPDWNSRASISFWSISPTGGRPAGGRAIVSVSRQGRADTSEVQK
jgi:hypothetical protein